MINVENIQNDDKTKEIKHSLIKFDLETNQEIEKCHFSEKVCLGTNYQPFECVLSLLTSKEEKMCETIDEF